LTPAAERILDVAGRLFYANGIHAVGVELIAGQAGVTKKTLYDRFGSKDALVTGYLRRRHERWSRHVLAVVERNPRTPPAKQLLLVFDALEGWMATENYRGCGFILLEGATVTASLGVVPSAIGNAKQVAKVLIDAA
jgi:AcrR family transcriptional regulator